MGRREINQLVYISFKQKFCHVIYFLLFKTEKHQLFLQLFKCYNYYCTLICFYFGVKIEVISESKYQQRLLVISKLVLLRIFLYSCSLLIITATRLCFDAFNEEGKNQIFQCLTCLSKSRKVFTDSDI